MATTTAYSSYKTRMIYKEHSDSESSFAGSYKLLGNAKSMPAPFSTPNTIDATSLEDSVQVLIAGVQQNEQKTINFNMESTAVANISAISGKKIDIIQLYGNDGVGGLLKVAYVADVTWNPGEVSNYDSVLEMQVTITPNSVPEILSSTITESNGTFTVA